MKRTILFVLCTLIIALAYAGNHPGTSSPGPEVTLKEITPFPYCCIAHRGPYTEISNKIAALMDATRMQNIHPSGLLFTVYYNSPEEVSPEELEWEVGFPVMAQVAQTREPLIRKQWLFTRVASAVHVGPYENVGETIMQMMEWMAGNNYVPDGPVLERYLNMPTPDTNPADYRTEVWIPVKIQ